MQVSPDILKKEECNHTHKLHEYRNIIPGSVVSRSCTASHSSDVHCVCACLCVCGHMTLIWLCGYREKACFRSESLPCFLLIFKMDFTLSGSFWSSFWVWTTELLCAVSESVHPTWSFSYSEVGLLCVFLGEPSVIQKVNQERGHSGFVLVLLYHNIWQIIGYAMSCSHTHLCMCACLHECWLLNICLCFPPSYLVGAVYEWNNETWVWKMSSNAVSLTHIPLSPPTDSLSLSPCLCSAYHHPTFLNLVLSVSPSPFYWFPFLY